MEGSPCVPYDDLMSMTSQRKYPRGSICVGCGMLLASASCVSIHDDTPALHRAATYTFEARVDTYSVSNLGVAASIDDGPFLPMTGPTDGNLWTLTLPDTSVCRTGFNVKYQATYDTGLGH